MCPISGSTVRTGRYGPVFKTLLLPSLSQPNAKPSDLRQRSHQHSSRTLSFVSSSSFFPMVKKKVVSMGFGYKYFDSSFISHLEGPSASGRDFKQFLIEYHDFVESDIRLLVDDKDPSNIPTANEILEIIRESFTNAEVGDTMVLHMCGHEKRVQTPIDNNSAYIESFICGWPKDQSGIRSHTECTGLYDFNLREVCRGPEGCNLPVIADFCLSGGLVEGVNEMVGFSIECPKAVNSDTPLQMPTNAILFSACQSGDITGAAYSLS